MWTGTHALVSTGPGALIVSPPTGRWSDGERKGIWGMTSVHFTMTPSPGLWLYTLIRLYSRMIVQKYTSISSVNIDIQNSIILKKCTQSILVQSRLAI